MAEYVYIVTSDARETRHPQVRAVRALLSDAYEDAKRYILQHNDEEYVQADRNLPAREFVEKYTSAWLTSGSILRRKIR